MSWAPQVPAWPLSFFAILAFILLKPETKYVGEFPVVPDSYSHCGSGSGGRFGQTWHRCGGLFRVRID